MIEKTEQEIIKNWKRVYGHSPLVSIRCMVFNHEKYIEQCLDGLLMQVTDFPFELIVHDDCSTDSSAYIIQKYAEKFPKIIKPVLQKENQHSKGIDVVSTQLIPMMTGKYIAFCEGDDYWIDESKLQKQVDYMELHPECGLCFTDFNIFCQDTNEYKYDLLKTHAQEYPSNYSLEEWIIKAGYVAPMTWVYRKELYLRNKRIKTVDGTFVLFSHFLYYSNVHCMKEVTTAVYRILSESASHSKNPERVYIRAKGLFDTRLELVKRYNLSLDLIETINNEYFVKFYKLISVFGESAERDLAIQYNKSIKRKLFIQLTKISMIRNFLRKLWFVKVHRV